MVDNSAVETRRRGRGVYATISAEHGVYDRVATRHFRRVYSHTLHRARTRLATSKQREFRTVENRASTRVPSKIVSNSCAPFVAPRPQAASLNQLKSQIQMTNVLPNCCPLASYVLCISRALRNCARPRFPHITGRRIYSGEVRAYTGGNIGIPPTTGSSRSPVPLATLL